MGKTTKEIYIYYYFAQRVNYFYAKYIEDMLSYNQPNKLLYMKLNSSLINKINFSIYDKLSCGFTKSLYNLKNNIIECKIEELDCFKIFELQILEGKHYNDYINLLHQNSFNNSKTTRRHFPKKYDVEMRKLLIDEITNELFSNPLTKVLLVFANTFIWRYYQTEELSKLEQEMKEYLEKFNHESVKKNLNYDFFQSIKYTQISNTIFYTGRNTNLEKETIILNEVNQFLNNYYQVYAKTNFIFKNRELFLFLNAFILHLTSLEENKTPSIKEIKDFTLLHYFQAFTSPHLYFHETDNIANSKQKNNEIDKNNLL
jgi:hypothetical protein